MKNSMQTQQEITFNVLKYQLVQDVVGCAFASYNFYHAGMDELIYEAGLMSELIERGYDVRRQEEFPVYYKGRPTPVNRRLDLVIQHKQLGLVILELKALDYCGDPQRRQLWSYMKLMNGHVGMLINFSPKGVYTENWELSSNADFCTRF